MTDQLDLESHLGAEDRDERALPSRANRLDPAGRVAPLAVAALILAAVRPLSDPDTFWHIAAGDLLRQSFDLNRPDPFTHATSHAWVLEQWLPEMLFSYLKQWGGLGAVAAFVPVTYGAFLLLTWWVCRSHTTARMALIIMVLTAAAVAASFSPRPQVLSFIFVIVTVEAWLRTGTDGRPRWWLIPMTWLWACCHGFWFYGPLLGGLFIVGMALDRKIDRRAVVRLAMIPLVSFVAALLTPLGPAILLAPIRVHTITRFITEWQAPSARYPYFIAMLVLVAMVLVAMSRRSIQWHLVFPVAMALGTAFMYVRAVAVAGAILAPIVATLWAPQPRSRQPRHERRLMTWTTLASVAVASAVCALAFPRADLPVTALDAQIAALPNGTVVCNDSVHGGWLILEHPNVQVTMDGRAELYSVAHFESYFKFMSAEPGWHNYVNQTGCTYALIGVGTAASEALIKQARWSTAATGGGCVLLKAPERS